MQAITQIIIGSGLDGISEKEGKYEVLYMNTKLIFNTSIAAAEAYKEYSGEASLWDLGNENDPVRLLQAKLMKDFPAAKLA